MRKQILFIVGLKGLIVGV